MTGTGVGGDVESPLEPKKRHPSGRPTIGLLAGMGVRSTGPFLDFVIAECQEQLGARSEPDFPPMVVFSWPLPYYFDRELDHADIEETIGVGLEWLESTGVDFIAMPCNSAHVYYERLVRRVSVPVIDMVEVAAEAVPSDAGPVALLATRSTNDSRLYQTALRERGIEVDCPERVQSRLDALLETTRTVSDLAPVRAEFLALLEELAAGGVRTGLMACTDLNYLVEGDAPLNLVDAGEALASRVVTNWRRLADGSAGGLDR